MCGPFFQEENRFSLYLRLALLSRLLSPLSMATPPEKKAHVIVFPYPALGHINPMMQLSRVLVSEGFRITFVCTQFHCERMLKVRRQVSGEEDRDIHLEGLPDGLPDEFDRLSPSTDLSRAVDNLGGVFEEFMSRLIHTPACSAAALSMLLISDTFLPWTQGVAAKFLIPRVLFWTQSAAVFTIFINTCRLLDSGFNPFEEDLDTATSLIDFIPGIPALPASHLPYRTFKPLGSDDRRFLLYDNLAKLFEQCKEAVWIIVNSFDSLEGQALQALQSDVGISVKLLGPLLPLPILERRLPECMCAAEDEDVVQWLDMRAASSVLYICLGSVVTWEGAQVDEVGLGLMAKRQAFLWVMRPWEMRLALPLGLSKLGKVVRWAPQLLVLGHPAIGGFMSHCGWNSTLESMSMGVPILAWPHFLDQFTNCWFVVHEWKVGVELQVARRGGLQDAVVDRIEIERAVGLLMQEEEGRQMRFRASKLRDSAQKAILSGSSHRNLQVFLEEHAPATLVT